MVDSVVAGAEIALFATVCVCIAAWRRNLQLGWLVVGAACGWLHAQFTLLGAVHACDAGIPPDWPSYVWAAALALATAVRPARRLHAASWVVAVAILGAFYPF
jgi:hypothetical protein